MNFGNRLSLVRKEKGLNQEQLAEMLGVTRQTIYKWEASITYPDIDKLCDIAKKLGVSTAYLLEECEPILHTEANEEVPRVTDKNVLTAHFISFSRLIAIATFIILTGVAQLVILAGLEIPVLDTLSVVFLLVAIFSAVIIYVYAGITHENYLSTVTGEVSFCTEETEANKKRFTLKIVSGLIIIFSAIILLVVSGFSNNSVLPIICTGIMFVSLAFACSLFITGGILNELYTNPRKSLAIHRANGKKDSLDDTVSGIIMLLATAVFVIFGFLYDAWHPAWIAFPIGGILCGVASSIIKLIKGSHASEDEEDDD